MMTRAQAVEMATKICGQDVIDAGLLFEFDFDAHSQASSEWRAHCVFLQQSIRPFVQRCKGKQYVGVTIGGMLYSRYEVPNYGITPEDYEA